MSVHVAYRRLLRSLVALFVVGGIVSLILVGIYQAKRARSTADLKALFYARQSEFNDLAAALIADQRNIDVYRDSSAAVSVPDRHETEELGAPDRKKLIGLLSRAGLAGSKVTARRDGPHVRIRIDPVRSSPNEFTKGYVFCTRVPGAIVEDLDVMVASRLNDRAVAYERLDGNWYLYIKKWDQLE